MTELGVERRGGGGNFPDHAKVQKVFFFLEEEVQKVNV